MNKIMKVFLVIEREIIKVLDCFSPRLYMKMYNPYLKKIGIQIKGTPRYICPSVDFDGKGYNKTFIGDNVVISKDVLILNHDYSITCGLRSIGEKIGESEAYWLKEVKIGNNVFVGAKSILLPGTIIGDNCIVGAGSVVKGTIPSNSIVVGNPSKVVSKLDEWAEKKKTLNDYLWE